MLAAFVEAMQAKAEDYQDRWVGITHVDNTEEAHALAEAVKKRFNPARIIIGPDGQYHCHSRRHGSGGARLLVGTKRRI